mmetsp:Transcript_98290/g.136509  ORF Transcript_98290/g.136509 Transcript_98290/m.136509 type:complete len:231 (+) Transcript_98290:20-712(+)
MGDRDRDYDRGGGGRPPIKLWVGCGKLGVDGGLTEEDLRETFEKCGRVTKCWVARQPSGFAFIEFEDDRDAEDALKLDGTEIKGEPLQVQVSRNRASGPGDSSRKPGDWLCPQCRVNNFARRDVCFRCQAPKPRDGGYDDRRGGYDDRRGGYDDRRGGYDDRRGGYDDRRGGYDDRGRGRDRYDDYDRRDRYDDRRDRYDDRDRRDRYDRVDDRRDEPRRDDRDRDDRRD